MSRAQAERDRRRCLDHVERVRPLTDVAAPDGDGSLASIDDAGESKRYAASG